MKQYKITYGNYSTFTKTNKYYFINNKPNGLYYITFYFTNDKNIYKGYYNMDEEYSHWLEYKMKIKIFKYYL